MVSSSHIPLTIQACRASSISQAASLVEEVGIAWLKDVSEEEVVDLAFSLGTIVKHSTLTPNKVSPTLSCSFEGMELHTDHHSVDYIILFCRASSGDGGQTILVHGQEILRMLPEKSKTSLKHIMVKEHKLWNEDTGYYPLLSDLHRFPYNQLYYAPWLIEESSNTALYEFMDVICRVPKITHTLMPREILLIDNKIVLHGRSPIGKRNKRIIDRYWITKPFK